MLLRKRLRFDVFFNNIKNLLLSLIKNIINIEQIDKENINSWKLIVVTVISRFLFILILNFIYLTHFATLAFVSLAE